MKKLFVLAALTTFAASAQERKIATPDDDPPAREANSKTAVRSKPIGAITGSYGLLELQRCSHDNRKITCRFTFTPSRDTAVNYLANRLFPWNSLVDNILRQHAVTQSYFLDRLGKPMPSVNLSGGDDVTFVQEFAGASAELITVRLVAPRTKGEIRDIPVKLE